MKITFDIKFLLIAIASFIVAGMTVTETIDKYITFAGEANAAGFFLMAATLGMITAFMSSNFVSPDFGLSKVSRIFTM